MANIFQNHFEVSAWIIKLVSDILSDHFSLSSWGFKVEKSATADLDQQAMILIVKKMFIRFFCSSTSSNVVRWSYSSHWNGEKWAFQTRKLKPRNRVWEGHFIGHPKMRISWPGSEILSVNLSQIIHSREKGNNSCLCQGMAVVNGLENTDLLWYHF